MPQTEKSEAIVIRTFALREQDLVVVFLTRLSGKLRAVARGARGGRVRRFGSAFQPATVVTIDWFDSRRSELVRIDDCSIIRSYFSNVANDLRLAYQHAYFLELTEGFTVQGNPQDDLYRLLRLCLECAARAGDALIVVRRYFEFWLLRLSGLFPDISSCQHCGAAISAGNVIWIHPDEGTRCAACSSGHPTQWKLSAGAARRLYHYARTPLEGLLSDPQSSELSADTEIEPALTGFLEHHLHRRIRSLDALHRTDRILGGRSGHPDNR